MGTTHLKSLNSLPLGHRFATEWGLIIRSSAPDLLLFIERLYFEVLNYYRGLRKPCPLAHLTRLYAKRWITQTRMHALPDLMLRDLIVCTADSHTLPITITITARGGLLILPNIVPQTYWSRLQRGESVPNLEDMLTGKEFGPELSELGVQLASAPFGDVSGDVLRPPEHKLDTPHFPELDPAATPASYPDEAPTDQ